MTLAVCTGGLPGAVQALGVSNPLTHSSLGQPLNLLFPLRLNPGETVGRDCVRAEVMAGEARLPQGLVQFRLESDGTGHVRGVRLLTSVQVDEPIVTVNLSLGCPAQLTRQFTAFIDPPDARPTVASPLVADAGTVADSAAAAPAAQAQPLASAPPAATARLVAQAPAAPPPPPSPPPKPRARPRPKPAAIAAAPAASHVAAAEPAAPKAEAAPVSRLRMDPLEVPVESAASAASAASAPPPASINDETLARLQQLEDKLDQVHKENVAAEDQFKLLRAQLAEAREQRYHNVLVYGLGAFLAALALICAYLWLSLRREREQREHDWRHEADRIQREREASRGTVAPVAAPAVALDVAPARPHAPPPSPLPPFSPAYQPEAVPHGVTPDSRTLPAIARPALDSILQDEVDPQTTMASAFVDAPQRGAWPPSAGSERESQPTAPLPLMQEAIQLSAPEPRARQLASSVVLDDENHEVSVEELIDLEQQVDFFEVLGQDDAAIDLLTLRIATGQESALPYLKLLEIYQRRGDEAAFNALCGDFARNFKAVPPSWGAKLNEGRGLESYPRVLEVVQQHWSDAGASMALLQNLLSHGGEDAQGFDLPAYRDLLMLYGLARDQSEREVRGEQVDLFLPLDAGSPSAGTSMMATQPIAPSAEAVHLDLSLDIDLDEPPVARDSR